MGQISNHCHVCNGLVGSLFSRVVMPCPKVTWSSIKPPFLEDSGLQKGSVWLVV